MATKAASGVSRSCRAKRAHTLSRCYRRTPGALCYGEPHGGRVVLGPPPWPDGCAYMCVASRTATTLARAIIASRTTTRNLLMASRSIRKSFGWGNLFVLCQAPLGRLRSRGEVWGRFFSAERNVHSDMEGADSHTRRTRPWSAGIPFVSDEQPWHRGQHHGNSLCAWSLAASSVRGSSDLVRDVGHSTSACARRRDSDDQRWSATRTPRGAGDNAC
jgi:hypothetical protein